LGATSGVYGGDTVFINEPFIFALNDQELELNGIENSIILAAQVQKSDWI